MHSFSEQFVGSSAARGVYGKEKEFGSNGVHEVEFPRQFFRSERPSAITCVADSQASTSISRQPRELLVPIPQLVEARVIFAAAPALGHYQVNTVSFSHSGKNCKLITFFKKIMRMFFKCYLELDLRMSSLLTICLHVLYCPSSCIYVL